MKLCIDAGHGGSDPGAVGPTGLEEAACNLKICEDIEAGLERLGLSVMCTRKNNANVSLGRRCQIANEWCADYFVSIHCNSNGPSAYGVEVLYKTEKGKALAAPIQEMLLEATGDRDRGLVCRENLHVLNATNMPACLAEVGFISHPDTETLLKSKEYLHILAEAIVAGIAKFLQIKPAKPVKY